MFLCFCDDSYVVFTSACDAASMPFFLRIRDPGPDLSRARTLDESAPAAPSRLAFWRGLGLGFASAMVVLDCAFLHGAAMSRVGFAIRHAFSLLTRAVHGA